jgi:hypothetical protein
VGAPRSPQEQLAAFIARYDPEIGALARAVLARLRKRLPGAVELVYDNYNALAVGFGPTERASEAILSLALYPRWVSLFFLQGAALPDPQKLLRGSGARVRHIVLESPAALEKPAVRALIADALERAARPLDGARRGRIVIRSVSAKQRPRRPVARRPPRVRGG